MSLMLLRCTLAAVLVPLSAVPAPAQGVSSRPAMSLGGGARVYESQDGASTVVSAAIRSELPVAEIFVLELAGSVADVPEDATSGIASLFESQLQIAIPLGEVLTPYAGAGAGIARVKEMGEMTDDWKAIFTAAVGARVSFSSNLGAVVDARIRGRGSQIASHIDTTVGVRYQFGRPDRPRFRGGRSGSAK